MTEKYEYEMFQARAAAQEKVGRERAEEARRQAREEGGKPRRSRWTLAR